MHHAADIDEDWSFEKRPWVPHLAYGQSKTANMLFTVGLDSRGAKFGVHSFACHPGSILTELNRVIPKEEFMKIFIQFGDADE
jgi:NAD(P)-dependent dehydrogenase (short-subunit alcohol dehydrogenase family)